VDVQRHYPVDRERVSVTGYSMGGYGTYRLTTLFPELFSAAAVWAGVPAYYIWAYPAPPLSTPTRQEPGKTIDQLQNLGSVPFFLAHGTHDELVPVSGVTAMANRFEELGYEHRYELFAGIDHFSFTYIDDWHPWANWLGDRRRVRAPATVSFAARPASWVDRVRTPQEQEVLRAAIDRLARELGAELDSAYWVRDVAVAGEGDVLGKVELTSGGLPLRRVTGAPVREVNPGPPYVIGLTVQAPPPYGNVVTGRTRTMESEPTTNTLTGRIAGVSALTVDLDRARLRLEGLKLDVEVDRPVTLKLRSGKRVRTVSLEPSS
jgi:dienelactone hydrolase